MKICLFGAGSKSIDQKYVDIGYKLGEAIAKNNHTLVFGGGNDGLMGAVARGVSDNKGEIIAIFPEWMNEYEDLFIACDKQILTNGMDDRKKKFIENADCILVTPGGIGTLDEFFEVLTLKKLNVHDVPIIIFNINNFFDRMLDMLNEMIEECFVDSANNNLFIVTSTIEETLEYL